MRYLALFLFFLAGCTEGENNRDFDRTGEQQRITVFVHDTQAKLETAYLKYGKRGTMEKYGFAGWGDGICEIHLTKGATNATWGHELKHCIYGSYHD